MSNPNVINKLTAILEFLKLRDLSSAKILFDDLLPIVDSELHLNMPSKWRHLIWDLYELLIIENADYTNIDDIVVNYQDLISEM